MNQYATGVRRGSSNLIIQIGPRSEFTIFESDSAPLGFAGLVSIVQAALRRTGGAKRLAR